MDVVTLALAKKNCQGLPGEDGVSIESVTQTTISTEDGGKNIITITLSNGETSEVEVQNGSKGPAGPTDYNLMENKPDLSVYASTDYVDEVINTALGTIETELDEIIGE